MEDPPDVINGPAMEERKPKLPSILDFDWLIEEKGRKEFAEKLLEIQRTKGFEGFEKYCSQDFSSREAYPDQLFELYKYLRDKKGFVNNLTIKRLTENHHIFNYLFAKYINAKKSKIIDDLLKKYE